MDLFEFIMILVSMVVGLGLTTTLSGVAQAISRQQFNNGDYLPLLLSLLVFLALIQVWWDTWTLRTITEWSFDQVLLMLINPVLLYVLAHVLFPEQDSTALVDHYFARKGSIYTLVALAAGAAVLAYPLAFGTPFVLLENSIIIANVAGAILLAKSANRMIHTVLLLSGAVFMCIDIAQGVTRIS